MWDFLLKINKWDFLLKINKRIGGIFGSIQLGIEEAAWYSNRKFLINFLMWPQSGF